MRRSPFSEKQIGGMLREQKAGAATGEVYRRRGVYWKANYGGMEVSDAKRLRAREDGVYLDSRVFSGRRPEFIAVFKAPRRRRSQRSETIQEQRQPDAHLRTIRRFSFSC